MGALDHAGAGAAKRRGGAPAPQTKWEVDQPCRSVSPAPFCSGSLTFPSPSQMLCGVGGRSSKKESISVASPSTPEDNEAQKKLEGRISDAMDEEMSPQNPPGPPSNVKSLREWCETEFEARISVEVERGSALPEKTDAYVKVIFRGEKRTTAHIPGEDPEWLHRTGFDVSGLLDDDVLTFEVWHHRFLIRDVYLGEASIKMGTITACHEEVRHCRRFPSPIKRTYIFNILTARSAPCGIP